MFAYADPGNTCNEVVARFGITLSQLTSWNPVLGYPDGKYCQVQFWAGYDYCVGVISRASPDGGMASISTAPSDGTIADDAGTASTATAPPSEMIADKRYVGLPDDGGPEDYLVQDINCTDLSGELYQECWQELNMNSWLRQWYSQEPQCKDRQKQRGCRITRPEVEAWTTTLLREYVGAGGADCTLLPGSCGYSPNPRNGEGIPPLARARYRYLHYNIFGNTNPAILLVCSTFLILIALHKFFNDWERTVTDAFGIAGDLTTAIVNSIDQRKPKKTNVLLSVILSVLSAGLFLLPAVGPIAGVSTAGIAAANVGVNAIKAAPAVAASLFPRGTADAPQKTEIDILSINTSTLIQDLRENIQTTLGVVQGLGQTDVDAFLAFAGNGNFSSNLRTKPPPDVGQTFVRKDRITPLLLAYTTFIASTTLQQTGWHAILLPGVDPRGITNGTTLPPAWAGSHENKHDLQCTGYNEFRQCIGTYWWYSDEQKSAYVLNKGEDEDSTNLLNRILSAGWSTGKLLFENAAVCEIQAFLRARDTIDKDSVAYTVIDGEAGFQFNGPLPGLEADDFRILDPSKGTNFLAFAGAGLTHLRQQEEYRDSFYHPTDADVWAFNNTGIDFSCISQIDVKIATVWGDNWM
ncbi:MAG: hypothetical protein Q9215_004767 [Flavoplaca cf. flavocitrina]